jgi:predicted O-linked N-acetylglucosamine transferase (SPINDLY family)
LLTAAIQAGGDVAEVHANLGRAYLKLGRLADALACHVRALALNPQLAEIRLDRANILLRLQRIEEAVDSFDEATQRTPGDSRAWIGLGNALMENEAADEAAQAFAKAIELAPSSAVAHYSLGNALRKSSRLEEAAQRYARATQLDGGFVGAHINHGLVLQELGRLPEALSSLDVALALEPERESVHYNRAVILLELHRPMEALQSAEQALRLRPDAIESLNCRGIALLGLRRGGAALQTLDRALQVDPGYPDALHNRGIALMQLRRFDEAADAFQLAIRARPAHVESAADAGRALLSARRYPEAQAFFSRAHELDAEYEDALGNLFYSSQLIADWSQRQGLIAAIEQGIAAEKRVASPFCLLAATDSARTQLQCAGILAASLEKDLEAVGPGRSHGRERIRVGYLSSDFREHAVAYLMAGVFEQHDRGRFEVTGLALRPGDSGEMASRVRAALDNFVDLSEMSDEESCEAIRSLELDVVVDLNGYTQGMRPGILARRVAPLQVNYLGFPGTMGAGFMDYIIADDFVIPAHAQEWYREKIAYLPECFQANDDRRPIPAPTPRAQLGLPQHQLILGSLNNTFKLNPPIVEIWMKALKAFPETHLWVLADEPAAQVRLQGFASAVGVDPARLTFAGPLAYREHLARCAAADLMLDTLPFGAGATASDVLWSGVPLLTCAGEAFAGRMAGSLLKSLSLDELIAQDLVDYEQRLHGLLRSPERLVRLREQLAEWRSSATLFNTARFTRHLERALEAMLKRSDAGLPPDTFHVESVEMRQ